MLFRSINLKGRLSSGLVSIYSSRIILGIGSSLMGLFLPIFLYQVFNHSLSDTLVYYLLYYSTYVSLVAVGAKFSLNKIGIKWAIIVSTVFGAIYFVMLYFINGPTGIIGSASGANRISVFDRFHSAARSHLLGAGAYGDVQIHRQEESRQAAFRPGIQLDRFRGDRSAFRRLGFGQLRL